jgi:hypothetical protein
LANQNTPIIWDRIWKYLSVLYPYDGAWIVANRIWTVFAGGTLQTQVQFRAEAAPFALSGQTIFLALFLTEHFLCFLFLVAMVVESLFALKQATFESLWLKAGLAPQPIMFWL